jgi:DNA adenine methylase
LASILARVPSTFERYFEPFLGGGAVFFGLQPQTAILSDSNSELMLTYRVVRDRPDDVIRELGAHENTLEHFQRVRAQLPADLSEVARAARFIYLNRTCYNGLYRVNRKGAFNVPFGAYKSPRICDPERLHSVAERLKDVNLLAEDYGQVLQTPRAADFVYLDPPYVPAGKFADFKRYNANPFGNSDHERLAEAFSDLDQRGCYVMASNSDTPLARALYQRWNIQVLSARRLVNKHPQGRGPVNELLITNY